MRTEIIQIILSNSKSTGIFDQLESLIKSVDIHQLIESIQGFGILPEVFKHDSSEEKIWAKVSDLVLAQALFFLGLDAKTIGARSNSADVIAFGDGFSLVADAKTFRLSRSAKNQKDFKIGALNNWRAESNYSLLVAPFLQFPTTKSQIYSQSIENNVTLLSYTHLAILLDHKVKFGNFEFRKILAIGSSLKESNETKQHQYSELYWEELKSILILEFGILEDRILEYFIKEQEITKKLGQEGINFWNTIIAEHH